MVGATWRTSAAERGDVIFNKAFLANEALPAERVIPATERWFVASTHPGKECLAQRNLEHQGFVTFLPRFRKPWRKASRVSVRLAPLFPGYIFVSFDPGQSPWRAINGTFGVRRLLGSVLQPQAVPTSFMAQLKARCSDDILDNHVDQFHTGRQVRIISGPFADRLAVIERLENHDRIGLLLEVMGTTARLAVASSELLPE